MGISSLFGRLRERATQLKRESLTLYYAYQDPEMPRRAKVFTALVVAYAFSPIDLIPDFVPVLGYLDDMFLVPIGVAIASRMIPHEVMERARLRAAEAAEHARPASWQATVIIVAVWLLVVAWLALLVYRFLTS